MADTNPVANNFVKKLPIKKLREFFNENFPEYHICYMKDTEEARKISYWEESQKNQGMYEMTFYDHLIIPRNPEIEERWIDFLTSVFGEEYRKTLDK